MSIDIARSFGVVAIGRNEGERLKRCLKSVSHAAQVIYVHSGSTDGSLQWANRPGSMPSSSMSAFPLPRRGREMPASGGCGQSLRT